MVDRSRQRPMTIARARARQSVSILVVVDRSRQLRHARLVAPRGSMFQSLLWWIGRVNIVGLEAGHRGPASFNPCCGGLVASTAEVDRSVTSSNTGFQSLLWWIGRVNVRPLRLPGRTESRCFNPCCGGLVASTRESGRTMTSASPMFQSLLWWIGRVNQLSAGRRASSATCFNPCCGGSVASTRAARHRSCSRDRVSILVVVDWSRQPATAPAG